MGLAETTEEGIRSEWVWYSELKGSPKTNTPTVRETIGSSPVVNRETRLNWAVALLLTVARHSKRPTRVAIVDST